MENIKENNIGHGLSLNTIYNMDCIEGMKLIPDCSIDSIITDPPYEIGFMGKGWDDTGIANNVDMWKECLRVLKPGGHLLSFAATRTYHRMACAIDDAGFEIRDMIEWVYGCLSEDTEILTKDGWKYYNKITGNNPVFCYNVDKDIFEYHLPTNYFLYENKHTAYRIQSDTTDQIVSRNHRVAVEQDGRIIFKYAETLKQQENIPVLESMPEMGETLGNEYKRTSYKEQILLGLCVKSYIREKEMKTEGIKLYVGDDMSGMLKAIYDEEKETLKVLLSEMQLNSEMKGVSEALTQVKSLMDGKIKAIIQSKDVMTELQVLEELRNTYEKEMKICKSDDKICEVSNGIYGDGKKGLICDGTQTESSNGNMKTFDEDGMRASHRSQCGRQQDGEFNVIQDELRTQELGELKKYTTTLATITEVEYDGYVWCVEVPTGCFVARRNGKIFITGNSGFPKSLNIGKAIDKQAGAKREVIGRNPNSRENCNKSNTLYQSGTVGKTDYITAPATPEAKQWEGWGTALKPAHEPICMARKPLEEKTVAENVLKYGTGGINIDESRVEYQNEQDKKEGQSARPSKTSNANDYSLNHGGLEGMDRSDRSDITGRFPANLILEDCEEVRECFPNESERFFKSIIYQAKASKSERNKGCEGLEEKVATARMNASEFRYEDGREPTPRAEQSVNKNNHPTVKPIALMEYLIKMVTKEGGTVLDPFVGSGTTLVAAKKNGYNYIGFELDKGYRNISNKRIQALSP